MTTTSTINEQLLLPEFPINERLKRLREEVVEALKTGEITPREVSIMAMYMRAVPLIDPTVTNIPDETMAQIAPDGLRLLQEGWLTPLKRTITYHTYNVTRVLTSPDSPPFPSGLPTGEKEKNRYVSAFVQAFEADVLERMSMAMSQGVDPIMAANEELQAGVDGTRVLQGFGMKGPTDEESDNLTGEILNVGMPVYFAGRELGDYVDREYTLQLSSNGPNDVS